MSGSHTKHSLFEKCFFRTGAYGGYFIGAYAIFQENIWIAALYIIFMWLSLTYVLKHFCSHCPYPCKHSDCLMVPSKMVTKYTKSDQKPMSKFERMSFPLVMFVAIPLIPQYWLFKNYTLLFLFWAVLITTGLALLLFRCNNCLNKECPLNWTK